MWAALSVALKERSGVGSVLAGRWRIDPLELRQGFGAVDLLGGDQRLGQRHFLCGRHSSMSAPPAADPQQQSDIAPNAPPLCPPSAPMRQREVFT